MYVKEGGPYPVLRGILRERRMQLEQLALWLGISVSTVYTKINGKTDWTLTEAVTIKEKLGYNKKLELLFTR